MRQKPLNALHIGTNPAKLYCNRRIRRSGSRPERSATIGMFLRQAKHVLGRWFSVKGMDLSHLSSI